MKKILAIWVTGMMMLTGCQSPRKSPQDRLDDAALLRSETVRQARQLITQGKAECVLIQGGRIVQIERGHGVSPLLALYDRHTSAMKGAVIVDKVIGRAAAAVAIAGGACAVYGEVMSEDAAVWLYREKITPGWTTLVPRILNRKRSGLCPLEQAVSNCETAPEAVAALRRKVQELSKKPKQEAKK